MTRGEFIAKMANKHGWTTGAELGVREGQTFLHLLESCPQLAMIGVDLWDVQPDNIGACSSWSLEHHLANYNTVKTKMARFPGRASLYRMSTDKAAKLIEDESLDFIFIDADHSEEAVRRDIENWSPKVQTGGAIIGHDIDWPTVQDAVKANFDSHFTGPDNIWYVMK